MRKIVFILLTVLCATAAPGVHALNVFACEPEWASLIAELAGDKATVITATTAFQDPHRLQAKPSLLAAARSADLLVCTGADLEIGWLPLLQRRSGNPAIRAGAPGYFLAANVVRMLEVPTLIDRSQGDIHPQGNPHIHLNPKNIARIADKLTDRLIELDSANTDAYEARREDFLRRWSDAIIVWEQRGTSLTGLQLVSHHRSFSYLADWLDLDIVATLEPKPGIPASGSYLGSLLEQLSPQPPAAIIRTPYTSEKASAWLSKRLTMPILVLPYTVGGVDSAVDLFGLFDTTLQMLEGLQP